MNPRSQLRLKPFRKQYRIVPLSILLCVDIGYNFLNNSRSAFVNLLPHRSWILTSISGILPASAFVDLTDTQISSWYSLNRPASALVNLEPSQVTDNRIVPTPSLVSDWLLFGITCTSTFVWVLQFDFFLRAF